MKIQSKIPKIIHLVFLNKNEPYPETFINCINRIKKLHPKWKIEIYNEDDAHKVISEKMPFYKPVYDNYAHTVQKADMLRVILVYLFGGFYLDMDILILKPLDYLCRFNLVLSEEKTISHHTRLKIGLRERLRVANYMFGSSPKHPFWLRFIQSSIGFSTKEILTENDILESTGPGLLSNLYGKYKYIYPDIVMLKNIDRKCLRAYHNEIACHFGNYAAHLHQGTWRWGNENLIQLKDKMPSNPLQKQISDAFYSFETLIEGKSKKKYQPQIISKTTKPHLLKIIKKVKFSKRIAIVCDDSLDTFEVNKGLYINILYLTQHLSPHISIKEINRNYDYCIVTSSQLKKQCLRLGLKIQIIVILPYFSRLIRNFYKEFNSKTFNIGLRPDTGCQHFIPIIIAVCNELFEIEIPNLRLKIGYTDPEIYHDGFDFKEISDQMVIKGPVALSNWYNKIHCFIYLSQTISMPFTPLESLYLGIPTLVNHELFNGMQINTQHYNSVTLNQDSPICEDKSYKKLFNEIKHAILKVYNDYENQQKKASRAANWLQDRWLIEESQQQIIEFLNAV